MSTEALLTAGAGGGGGARRRVSIDDALTWHAGEFGRWQLRHFVLVSAAWALEALHTMVIIFADREPAMVCPAGDRRCGDRCAGAAAGWEWAGGGASSTVAEWGLVCGERYKVGLVQAIFFAGCMIDAEVGGMYIIRGKIGRFGRKLGITGYAASGFSKPVMSSALGAVDWSGLLKSAVDYSVHSAWPYTSLINHIEEFRDISPVIVI